MKTPIVIAMMAAALFISHIPAYSADSLQVGPEMFAGIPASAMVAVMVNKECPQLQIPGAKCMVEVSNKAPYPIHLEMKKFIQWHKEYKELQMKQLTDSGAAVAVREVSVAGSSYKPSQGMFVLLANAALTTIAATVPLGGVAASAVQGASIGLSQNHSDIVKTGDVVDKSRIAYYLTFPDGKTVYAACGDEVLAADCRLKFMDALKGRQPEKSAGATGATGASVN